MAAIGIVTAVVDCGSIVQVFIDDAPYAADGNMWRRGAGQVIDEGSEVAFEVTDWGGLMWIAPAEEFDND